MGSGMLSRCTLLYHVRFSYRYDDVVDNSLNYTIESHASGSCFAWHWDELLDLITSQLNAFQLFYFTSGSLCIDVWLQVGDGTTSVVILAGELLRQCKPYVEEGVHPQVIIRAYRKATQLVSIGSSI